ncbi:MAG: hypothetical protein CL917_02800 [Deltaproteobacteria bacterium]|nr:hypothetical protein [Deltaproteobacteria bacterium]
MEAEKKERLNVQAQIEKLTGRSVMALEDVEPGLGHRHFFRVRFGDQKKPRSMIARFEPTAALSSETPSEPPLEPIRAFLEKRGLPVPRSYGDNGPLQLLEDLGNTSLENRVLTASTTERKSLYREACALIPRLQRLQAPSVKKPAAFERFWNQELVLTKATKWLEWSFPLLQGRPAHPQERTEIRQAFSFVAQTLSQGPQRLAHRDFKAANLHFRNEVSTPKLTMIDLQGAFLAPPEYDLVCLLRDSHVTLPEVEVISLLEETRPDLPDQVDKETFLRRFDLITLVRVCKDLSHYLHAATQLSDRRYLPFVPQALSNLRKAAERADTRDPEVGPLTHFLLTAPETIEIPMSDELPR